MQSERESVNGAKEKFGKKRKERKEDPKEDPKKRMERKEDPKEDPKKRKEDQKKDPKEDQKEDPKEDASEVAKDDPKEDVSEVGNEGASSSKVPSLVVAEEVEEPSVLLLEKENSTLSDKVKERARYESKRDAAHLELQRNAALAVQRGRSERTRKLAPTQSSPYKGNNTAKTIIPNSNKSAFTPFHPLDKAAQKLLIDHCKTCPEVKKPMEKRPVRSLSRWYKTLRTSKDWLDDSHMDAWINVLRKRYHANPEMFRSERICFLDHLFSRHWSKNFDDFKADKPDFRGLGRRLPGGAWNYYSGKIPSFCRSMKVWGKDIDDIYAPVNYKDFHWISIWISIPDRRIVVFDTIIPVYPQQTSM
ncbi:uncharacterized protein LOC130497459 [Raphanus sativus]|uniref:Uncharacterized protein LOC130497459 n=1 Tax=Raphanus sativus TaxID=3726 RepID=A0A9W3C3U6_RAPSA|nr:uncharacterized protein LOC130497459 [Raphanus sativus]